MSFAKLYAFSSCYGCSESHLMAVDNALCLHVDAVAPWQQLCEAAQKAGFELKAASAFRSFDRQCSIWNGKLRGERPVLDDHGHPLDMSDLSSLECIKRVMRWSALPGASRHHWGSDIDIYDGAAMFEGDTLQLITEEYTGDGPFVPLMEWLRTYLDENQALGFYFPYQRDCGGVKPEPWHLSFRPVAERFQSQWSLTGLRECIADSNIEEKQTVLDHLDELFRPHIVSSINPEDPV